MEVESSALAIQRKEEGKTKGPCALEWVVLLFYAVRVG